MTNQTQEDFQYQKKLMQGDALHLTVYDASEVRYFSFKKGEEEIVKFGIYHDQIINNMGLEKVVRTEFLRYLVKNDLSQLVVEDFVKLVLIEARVEGWVK